jgi:hypothetical protein
MNRYKYLTTQQHDDMVKRFRTATNQRLAVLQDEQHCTGTTTMSNVLRAVANLYSQKKYHLLLLKI